MTSTLLYNVLQWKTLISAVRVSSSLSIISSILIIVMVFRGQEKLASLQNRLLAAMSFFDILNSLALGVNTAALPRAVSDFLYGAYGSKATCTLQGFFITLGGVCPMYNVMLCLNYLMIIKYNIKDEILERYERYMHAISILLPLSLAIFGACLDLYHPTFKGYCWTTNDACQFSRDDSCTTPRKVYVSIMKYGIFVCGIIIIFTITSSMVMIYLAVRKQSKTMEKYQFQRGNSVSRRSDSKRGNNYQETKTQASLYTAGYFLCYIWQMILVFFTKKIPMPLMFLSNVFYPSQGLLNLVVFVRPRYVIVREKMKDASSFWILRIIMFGRYQQILAEEEKKKRQESRRALVRKGNDKRLAVKPMENELQNDQICLSSTIAQELDPWINFTLSPTSISTSGTQKRSSLPAIKLCENLENDERLV